MLSVFDNKFTKISDKGASTVETVLEDHLFEKSPSFVRITE